MSADLSILLDKSVGTYMGHPMIPQSRVIKPIPNELPSGSSFSSIEAYPDGRTLEEHPVQGIKQRYSVLRGESTKLVRNADVGSTDKSIYRVPTDEEITKHARRNGWKTLLNFTAIPDGQERACSGCKEDITFFKDILYCALCPISVCTKESLGPKGSNNPSDYACYISGQGEG